MINYSLFSKDDLGVLFEGFETMFLQMPFKRPTRAILRLVPKGFRVDKLSRKQMIKVFSDAIINHEELISRFVTNEIESQFESASITSFVNSHIENSDYLFGGGIATVSSLLWKNKLHIPAYIVYMLFGLEPTESCRNESMLLYKTFIEELEKNGTTKFNEGFQNAERKNQSSMETEIRRVERLEKTLVHAKEQRDDAVKMSNAAYAERDEALAIVVAQTEKINDSQKTIDRLEKNLTQALHAQELAKEEKKEMLEVKSQLSVKQRECLDKEKTIVELKTELSKAMEMAYTEKVLEYLCTEVLDELGAMTLGSKEILNIAKQRFSDEETVLAGWESLSEESNELIRQIIDQFSSGDYYTGQLDLLERMEDGILIRYAVTKSLKAILYNELEKREAEATIGERFSGKEKNEQ